MQLKVDKTGKTRSNNMVEMILDATMKVVSRNTISGTRMQLIADEAGIPKSNLHYHFQTKRNLLLALHKRSITRLIHRRDSIRTESQRSLREQLSIFFDQKLHGIVEEPEFDLMEIDFWVQSNIEPEFRKNLVNAFQLWREEILEVLLSCRPELSKEKQTLIPFVMISLMEGATLQYHQDSESFDIKAYMAYCVGIICDQVEK